jgi:hypothetical protein
MSEDRVMITLRFQAWERAKGELYGMIQTYWAPRESNRFDEVRELINDFIVKMDEEMG